MRFNFNKYRKSSGSEALVITHPYHGMDQPMDPYEQFLREYGDDFDVYFVEGTTIGEDFDDGNFPRVDLPSGYTEGLYDGAVRQINGYPGEIRRDDAAEILESNDRVLFGGENLFMCLRRTYNDFFEERESGDFQTDMGLVPEICYAPVTDSEGMEALESLESIWLDDLPIYSNELNGVDFLGGAPDTLSFRFSGIEPENNVSLGEEKI